MWPFEDNNNITLGENEFDIPDTKNPNISFRKKLFPCQRHSSSEVDSMGRKKMKKSIQKQSPRQGGALDASCHTGTGELMATN